MPRPPVKKTYKLAKVAELGRLQAQVEQEYKGVKWLVDFLPFLPDKYKKNAVLWMKHLFEKHVAKIPKGIAIIGMTYIIKRLIDTTEELKEKALKFQLKYSPLTQIPYLIQLTGAVVGVDVPQQIIDVTKIKYEGMFPDWADWLIAFTLAYIIVEHGGQIILGLGEGVKGLIALVSFFMG